MSANMTRFTDAVYHRKERYDFGKTVFTRRMLKVLLLVDGERTVSGVSKILSTDSYALMPDFAKLVKLGLIQTEGGIISAGISDLFYSEPPSQPSSEFTMTRLSTTVTA